MLTKLARVSARIHRCCKEMELSVEVRMEPGLGLEVEETAWWLKRQRAQSLLRFKTHVAPKESPLRHRRHGTTSSRSIR